MFSSGSTQESLKRFYRYRIRRVLTNHLRKRRSDIFQPRIALRGGSQESATRSKSAPRERADARAPRARVRAVRCLERRGDPDARKNCDECRTPWRE